MFIMDFSLAPGEKWEDTIGREISRSDLMIVIIGKTWLSVTDERGRRRLDDPGDIVRQEIKSALERGIDIVPVLVNDARMPSPAELPDILMGLARYQALQVRANTFNADVAPLVKMINTRQSVARRTWVIAAVVVLVGAALGAFLLYSS